MLIVDAFSNSNQVYFQLMDQGRQGLVPLSSDCLLAMKLKTQ